MKIDVNQMDIINAAEDVLVYSTNKSLMLSGGVGQALVETFGHQVQDNLYKLAAVGDKTKVRVGDVFVSKGWGLPWKKVLHTVVTDEFYYTDLDILKAVLNEVFELCDQSYGVKSIAMSALGCGYGDCSHQQFMQELQAIAKQYRNTDLERVVVYCKEPVFYQQLKDELAATS